MAELCIAYLRYLYFLLGGCAIVKYDKVGWIDRWDGAVIWNKREISMFDDWVSLLRRRGTQVPGGEDSRVGLRLSWYRPMIMAP